MAFRASNSTPAEAWELAKRLGRSVNTRSARYAEDFATGATFNEVLNCGAQFYSFSAEFDELAQVPGLADYARTEEDDPAYDVIAEVQNLRTLIENLITDLQTLLPQDQNGYLLENKLNADFSRNNRSFTGAQLQPLITRLQAIDAAVI